ncbi:hypothetical protein Tco_0103984 [Tanacetum coccineum]
MPEIRDQVFDVDKYKVTIAVVCCDPEKLRDKLCCKGGGAIQSIEIIENKPPPPPAPAPKPVVVVLDKPKDPPPPKPKSPVVVEVPKPQLEKKPSGKHVSLPPESEKDPPRPTCCQECYECCDGDQHVAKSAKGRNGGPCHYGYGRPVPPQVPEKCKPYPSKYADPPEPTPMPPVSACCQECNEGRDGGPCHHGYGRPVPPPPCYYYSGYLYPSNRPFYVSRCDYFSEDNPQGCSIM